MTPGLTSANGDGVVVCACDNAEASERMYRTIDTAIWDDPKVRTLPPKGKLLFVYLITNRHSHVAGIYYLPVTLITHETGLSERETNTLLHTLSTGGLTVYDRSSEVIWVKKMLDRQGKGKKNDKSAATQLQTLHNCPLIKDFLQFYDHRRIPYTIPHPLEIPSCLQEQEQKQEQKQEQEEEPPNPLKTRRTDLEVPDGLRCACFQTAWSGWLQYRREIRKPLRPIAQIAALKRLAKMGPERAAAAISHSIEQGYQGIYEDSNVKRGNSLDEPPRGKYDPARAIKPL